MRSGSSKWTYFVTFLSLFVCSVSLAQEAKDRITYVRSAYTALHSIVPILVGSETPEDAATQDFLKAAQEVLKNHRPELIFVNDSSQFVMSPGEAPRLMRAPEDPSGPIFVNEELLNSSGFSLSLTQVLKLLLHEVGHKTKLGSVASRDRAAQNVEGFLQSYYLTSGEDSESFVEALSLPYELIQYPLQLEPHSLQPSFWVYAHLENEIKDLTPQISEHISNNTSLTRTLGVEIQMVISEIANTFAQIIKEKVAPVFDQFKMMFSNPGEDEDSFADPLNKLKGPIKSMAIVELKRVGHSINEAVLDGFLLFGRSHKKKMGFNVTGLPWKDAERFPIQLKVRTDSSDSSVSLQLTPEPDFENSAKVGRIIRQSGVINSIDVTFPNETHPTFADLNLEYPGGTSRLRASSIESHGHNQYRAIFEFDSLEAVNTAYVERITVDNEEAMFLNRRIEINENVQQPKRTHLTREEITPGSIGIWGFRGQKWSLEKSFSHLIPSILFPLSGPSDKQFVINPYNLMIEFEIRSDLDISTAELFWSSEQMIFDNSKGEYQALTVNERIDGVDVPQRYTDGGTLVERKTLRESILFEKEGIKVLPSSREGYKIVRMKTITPIKHLRPLKSINEAHRVPNVTPISLRIVTNDLKSYFHTFSSQHDADELKSGIKASCDELLKAANSSSP